MGAGTYTMEIDRGLPLNLQMHLFADDAGTKANLTDCSFTGAIRPFADEDPAFALHVVVNDQLNGIITVFMADTDTAQLTSGVYAYDIVMTDAAGNSSVILRGPVSIKGVISL